MLEAAGLSPQNYPDPFDTEEMSGKKPLRIALDYDDTYTANKQLWFNFVKLCQSFDCEVRFVTARFETTDKYTNEELLVDARGLDIPVIFCNGVQKAQRCMDVEFDVDIWIDDFPVLIPLEKELECILRGVKVNDNKQRTVLRTSDKEKEEKINKWSSKPLVIGS